MKKYKLSNSTADGAYSYTYDAENHILSASNMPGGPYCYTYDGDGLRVAKAHGGWPGRCRWFMILVGS